MRHKRLFPCVTCTRAACLPADMAATVMPPCEKARSDLPNNAQHKVAYAYHSIFPIPFYGGETLKFSYSLPATVLLAYSVNPPLSPTATTVCCTDNTSVIRGSEDNLMIILCRGNSAPRLLSHCCKYFNCWKSNDHFPAYDLENNNSRTDVTALIKKAPSFSDSLPRKSRGRLPPRRVTHGVPTTELDLRSCI